MNCFKPISPILFFLCLFFSLSAESAKRYSDPDGCMSCHAIEGLNFIDENGITRSSSIDRSHYYSSLHGSVPCKDCHRKIVDYPHKVENGYVDCSLSCHVEEPSDGVAYTHKPIHQELEASVHGDGWYKDLAGGNRLEEIEEEQDPSCRRCHSNTLYIRESQLEKFKDAFDHAETECGNCHQGKAWMGQFGGHILRRFVGSRWIKNESNQICMDCHDDEEKMRKVELEDHETGEKHPPSERFVHAVKSYDKTLHARLLIVGSDHGAACLDCHATKGWRHNIGHYKDEKSESHPDQLGETCGQSSCHGYAKKPGNEGFVMTDMHDIALVNVRNVDSLFDQESLLKSPWFISSGPLLFIGVVSILGSLIWWLFFRHDKKIIAIVGGDRFERVMIGRKAKKKTRSVAKKPAARKTAAMAKTATKPDMKAVNPDATENKPTHPQPAAQPKEDAEKTQKKPDNSGQGEQ